MPPRNLNIVIVTAFVSVLCYFANQRAKTAMIVGNALDLIDAYYVDPVDKEQLLISAMDGMTATLDQHSEYIPQQDYESFQDTLNQEFAGIGIFVEQPEPQTPVRVITPLVGSPALKAGILPGDLIVAVNGQDVSSEELREVSNKLKGPVGTEVDLAIKRADETVSIRVQRGRIEIESVIGDYRDKDNHWVYRLRDEPSIAYVRLTRFGEKTVGELEQVLQTLDNDFSGLVLDLRGNGGGLLHAAAEVSDMFINSGKIVSTRIRGGEIEDRFDATAGTLVNTNKPLAILIDTDSASASEIVAACLQDNQRAKIVGTRSYGKGTVQNILPLQYGRSALRLTVARYYRPNGKNIHRGKEATEDDEWGVKPDEGLDVELDEETVIDLAKRWREASYPSLANESSEGTKDPATQNPPTEATGVKSSDSKPTDTNKQTTSDDEPDVNEGSAKSESDDSSKTPDAASTDPDQKTGLELDPQLRRAVEYLKQQSSGENKQPTTA
ncbi:MAG: S41 family peptidase [Rubripirellula sp.]|nr:S41 family peptidase [Rubripirellula sp.]